MQHYSVENNGHSAEETYKNAHEILRSQLTANINNIFKTKCSKSSYSTLNQNLRDFVKMCKFCNSSHPQIKYLAYEKVSYVCN